MDRPDLEYLSPEEIRARAEKARVERAVVIDPRAPYDTARLFQRASPRRCTITAAFSTNGTAPHGRKPAKTDCARGSMRSSMDARAKPKADLAR